MTEKLLQQKDFGSLESADLYEISNQCDNEISEYSGRAKAWQVCKNRVVEELERRFKTRIIEFQNQEQQRDI